MLITDYKKEGADARLVLTAMIVSDRVCGSVSQKWDEDGLFDSTYADKIGGWCVLHHKEFSRAPGVQILNYHRRYAAKKNRPDEESQAIDSLLAGMNAEFMARERKTLQADYVLKVATDLFTAVRIRRLSQRAQEYAAAGKFDKAVASLAAAGKVDLTQEGMIDVFEDKEALKAAFTESSDPVVVYPGAAGHFFKNRLKRRAFVAFEAPEKVGKSFWLLDVAVRGMQQGRKVAYFECGDMPREEVIFRLAARAGNRPVDPSDCDEGGKYMYPVSLDHDGVVLEERRIEKKMTPREAWSHFQAQVGKYGKGLFKLSCHATNTISVAGIKEALHRQRDQYGWVPDVVVCDYVDIMAPMNGTADTRDQINLTWKMLRSLAMTENCLCVTATQTNRGSYAADVISMEHTSEDKRKLSHVTFAVGLNQTDPEREQGIYRLNTPAARQGKHDKRKCLTVASCLAVSNPCVRSVY